MTISPGSQATSSAGPPVKSRRRELPQTRPTLLKSPRQKKGISRLRLGTRGPRPLLPCLAAMHGPRLRKTGRMAIAAPALQPPPPVAQPRGRMRRRSGSLIIGLRPSMEHTRQQARVRLPTIRVSNNPISSQTSSPTRGMAPVLSRASSDNSDNTDSQASSGRMASLLSLARMPVRTPRVADPLAKALMRPSDPAVPTAGPVLPTMPTAT